MPAFLKAFARNRRNLKAKQRRSSFCQPFETMEARRLLSAAIAPLGSMAITEDATALKPFKLRSSQVVKGVVGITSTDTVYSVDVTAEINLSLTLEHLLQKDRVFIDYADGTQVNSGWQSSKGTLAISQHLDPGNYYIDINHGFVAANTAATESSDLGAAQKVVRVKKYRIAVTDTYILVVRGLKHDSSIAPTEAVKPTAFSAAFGASGAQSEPTVSAALAQSSGFTQYQAFTAAEGYTLWGTGGPSPDDVVQQYIGDCYYMSIISSIARDDPGLIEQDIVAESGGDYLVKFENNGTEVDEQVDDMFPVNAEGKTVFAGTPNDVLWVAVLEKAWTYFRPSSDMPDSYDGIIGGQPSESLKAFGSPNAVDIAATNYSTAPSLLSAISTELTAGDLVDVGTESPENYPSSDPPLPSGLFTGHAYSVVKVDTADNEIELRNPWATNTQGNPNDGTGGYITITGDQLITSIADFSYGTLTAATPNPNPTPTPTPTPAPTPTPTTTTTTVQTLSEDLGPDSYQTSGGSNFDFFTFTANTAGQAEVTITSSGFTPELLIAEQGTNGWTTVSSDTNAAGSSTADVTFTAATGVTYGIGVFVSGSTDTGAYTLTLNGDLSAPVQATPNTATGSLTGVVYNDINGDGTQENGEEGIAGLTVYIDLNGTGAFAAGDPTATTNANGTYTFTGLAAGSYTVLVESASGYTQTSPAGNAGVTGTVTAGQASALAPIGEESQGGGTISGTVYGDLNGNGTQDNGETGLAGWYVYIDLTSAGYYINGDPYVMTDANGDYTFQNVAPGSYSVSVYSESGYTTTEGSDGYTATVTSTSSGVGANFGESQPAGGITGTVYSDDNGDGTQDDGEVGLSGWEVYIDLNNSGAYVAGDPTAYTDSNGTYSFTGLAAGTYTIGLVPQSGFVTNEGSDGWIATVKAGQTATGGSFGETQPPGGIYGTVYDSINGYGISDWLVFVDLNGTGVYASNDPYDYTDSYGDYSISDLTPGTYDVYAVNYRGWRATEGADGWEVTVATDQNTFSGDFGER